mgnify:CR=1 FL=1
MKDGLYMSGVVWSSVLLGVGAVLFWRCLDWTS